MLMRGAYAYACALVRYLVDDLIRAVRETVAETGDEKAKKRILQVVASAGRGGITKKELTRRTQFIRSRSATSTSTSAWRASWRRASARAEGRSTVSGCETVPGAVQNSSN